MGTISAYETAAGKRYRVRYRKPDHSQTDKRGFKTERSAELFLASTEVRKATGEYIDAQAAKVTIRTFGAEWLRTQTHLKASSYNVVETAWRVHVQPVWGRDSWVRFGTPMCKRGCASCRPRRAPPSCCAPTAFSLP